MKTTIATSIVALFGLERAIACNEIGCQMVAEELGMGFKTAKQIDGAPAGCVRFKNKGIFYVETCANDEDCDPDTCTAAKCKAINQQCAKMTFTFGEGASCQEGYTPITSSWEDCRDAALAIGLSDRAVNDVDLDFPWGTSRPKGCFRDGETKKIYFNTGAGGGAEEDDQILCEVGVAATPAPTPDPTPKPTPRPALPCTTEENIDYNGNDILNTKADDSQLCAKHCLDNQKCSFWTYRPSTRDCWLKHSKAGRMKHMDRISGNKACGSGSLAGANGNCYVPSKTVAQRDAMCAGDLKCARVGFDGRKFGGCARDSAKKFVAGPPFNHHCCSMEPTVGQSGQCWSAGSNMLERDAVCAGDLVCARKGFDGRDFGDCGNHHCCSKIPAGANQFTLRGDTGEELIRIVPNNFHKATVRLTKHAIKFASMSPVVTVEFTNDAHSSAGDRNVRFTYLTPHSTNSRDFIVQPVGGSVLNAWNGSWKCNTPSENKACGMVRRGEVFAWAGQYQISFIAKNEQCYIGCYVDDGSRDLDSYKGRGLGKYQGRGFDVDSCRKKCADLDLVDTPYAYFGVQHGDQCFCANAFATAPQYKKVPDSQCNMGKAPLTRGGSWRNSIYKIECDQLDLPCTDMELNIDYPGNDLNAGGYLGRIKGNLPNAAACRKACANTNGCKSWTFVKTTGDNCAVKRTTKARGQRRANAKTISGELCATSDSTWIHLNNGYITCNSWDKCQILRSLNNVALKDCKDRCSADSRCASIDWNPNVCHLKTQGVKAAKAAGKWYSRSVGQTSHWSKVTDTNVCWTRLPTGCSKPLSETSSSPAMWFIDPYANSGTCGKARRDAFNRHCGKVDAVQLWAYSPPAGALLCEHMNQKGRCCQETPGVYNYPHINSNKCKIGNDKLSSVVVADGCTIQLAQHSAPGTGKDTGRVYTLRGPGEFNAGSNFANDDISSFVIKCERGAAWRRRLAPRDSPLRRLQSEIFGEEAEGEGLPYGMGQGF